MICKRSLLSLIAIVVVSAAPAAGPLASFQAAAEAPTSGVSSVAACPVSRLVRAEPPKDPNADPFGFGPWYINPDRTIWAGWDAGAWLSGEKGNKVLWIRPQGKQLQVSGRRLDGSAPPLEARIPCCYPTGFQATGLFFPTTGCWEVSAKVGTSTLTFVTRVR